ncbi:MAG: hypothetical protein V4709_07445 [Pseudomonadota bacterium]
MARWLTLAFSLALMVIGGVQLSADLYYQVAKRSGWHSDTRRAEAAGSLAARLWQGNAIAYGGRLAAVEGDAQVLKQRYALALRNAPADAYRWTEFARALALVGDFGPAFDLAVQRAQRLAPRSPAVHLALADVRWRHGTQLSDRQLAALMPSFARTMQYPQQRQQLLDRIVRERRHPAFCAEYGARFTGGRWCAGIETRLAACATPETLSKPQRRWCRGVAALP